MRQELIFTNSVAGALDSEVGRLAPHSVFVLVDANTARCVLPRLQGASRTVAGAEVIQVGAGEENKSIATVTEVWRELSCRGCRRSSVLVNVGGGVITDMGAFAASTFKRGMAFINLPTTLLGAVDASVGGKTGVNFNGLKNEIGLFSNAAAVIVSTVFFDTLPLTELRSGYAEMLKHAMLESSDGLHRLLSLRVEELPPDRLLDMLRRSVEVKRRVVSEDPTEAGLRRSLNLGHTFAHAFESLSFGRRSPLPHGYAVAQGLVCAAIMSHLLLGLGTDEVNRLVTYVREVYGGFGFDCDDYPQLLEFMRHDKKADSTAEYNFTLLRGIGDAVIDCHPTRDDITATLDIYRDKMGL